MTAILALGAWMIWTSVAPARAAAAGAIILALVILAYGALATYFAHLSRPEARPAAVLMRDGSVILGLWIGQDSNWLYLGEVKPGAAHSGRIISIREDSILASTLGVPSQLREALAREPELGHKLWCQVKGRCGP